MPAAELPSCVFCGQPIGTGEETAGRAPMAAHGACADAALADDSHWDAIDAAGGGPEEAADEPAGRRGGVAGRSGCLLLMLALAGAPVLVLRLHPSRTRRATPGRRPAAPGP